MEIIGFVVRFVACARADVLSIQWVLYLRRDLDDNGLIHFVADDDTGKGLPIWRALHCRTPLPLTERPLRRRWSMYARFRGAPDESGVVYRVDSCTFAFRVGRVPSAGPRHALSIRRGFCLAIRMPSYQLSPMNELRFDRKLMARQAERFFGRLQLHAFEFVHHASWLNDVDPVLGRTFPFTHTGFERLLDDALIREDAEIQFTLSGALTVYRNSGSLDLTRSTPTWFECDQCIAAKRYACAARRWLARHAAFMLLPEFNSTRDELDAGSLCLLDSSVVREGLVFS